jgi:hypothetical protein
MILQMSKYEDATCEICTSQKKFLEEPCVLNCGHWFCVSCVNNLVADKNYPLCPKCRVEIPAVVYGKSIFIVELMKNLSLACSEKCGFSGNIDELKAHTCENMIIECPYSGCNEMITGLEFEKHRETCEFKPYPCEHCSAPISKMNVKNHLTVECTNFYVKHFNNYCGEMVLACNIEMHKKSCPFATSQFQNIMDVLENIQKSLNIKI